MKMLKYALFVLCALGIQVNAAAQGLSDTTKLFAAMKELQDIYTRKPVSFDMYYTYTSEKQPGTLLDSLSGHMDIYAGKYHYAIAGTEMIANERFVITLFKEDKIMYLSKPSQTQAVDPMQQIRQAIAAMGVSNFSFKEDGESKGIRINFNAGGPYKEMQMKLDKKMGYLTEMQYVVKTELLMSSPDDQAQVAAEYGEFAVVSCVYTGYKAFAPSADMFDEHKYFAYENKEFSALGAYSDYTVHVGSVDLVAE